MRTRIGMGGHGRRRWLTVGIAALLAAVVMIAFDVAPAAAVHDIGVFELDGNAVNGAAPG
jgi:hypothetical protein